MKTIAMPRALEIAHDPEQQLGLVGVEARGRLVEHQNPRVVLERAGDGDELLDGDRIGAERPLDVDVEVEPLQPLAREPARAAPGDRARTGAAGGRASDSWSPTSSG